MALYGLGHLNDTRLNILFEKNLINFMRPTVEGDETGVPDESVFSILVLHQNRYKGMHCFNPRLSITDELLPDFFDLVIWGHEHESIPNLREVGEKGMRILQPGSTVATSLIEAESKKKHSFLLMVDGASFSCNGIPLLTQRPLLHRQLELSKTGVRAGSQKLLEAYLKNEINKMLDSHDNQVAQTMTKEMFENMDRYPTKPLVRIKIDYSGGYSTLNVARFGTEFEGRIANPSDFIKFFKNQAR